MKIKQRGRWPAYHQLWRSLSLSLLLTVWLSPAPLSDRCGREAAAALSFL